MGSGLGRDNSSVVLVDICDLISRMTLLFSPRMCVVKNKCNNNNNYNQVTRRKSTGSYDGKGLMRIIQDNTIKKVESDKDSLGDDKESSSDSDDADSEGYDALDGFSFKMLKNISSSIATHFKLDIRSSKSS